VATRLSSLQLMTTTSSFNPKEAEDPFELLDMCVVALQDRRGPTREQAMAALGGSLEALPPLHVLDSRCLTVFALCGVSIKKGSSASASAYAKEARLAYRAVGLLALTLRAGASDWNLLAVAFPLLSTTLRFHASHDDTATLVAALDCLAAVTFAGAVDAEDVNLSMTAIWAVIVPPASRYTKQFTTAPVLAAALSAWTFLLTVTPANLKPDRAAWNATFASLAELLEHDHRAVRMAAGKALAVCAEHNLTQSLRQKDMEALAAKISDLAGEAGGKGVRKKLLPEQRHLFRQISSFLDDGACPKDMVTVRAIRRTKEQDRTREVIKVSSWTKVFQLKFLRIFLGAGFLKHLQCNALFEEAFSVEIVDHSKRAYKERKKARHKELKVNRDIAWERKNILCLPALEPEKLLQIGWN
jgi:hypothetical protein